MTTTWIALHPKAQPEHLGLIPDMLDWDDPRSAREQLDAGYQHGGGWRPFKGFTMKEDMSLAYPNDEDTLPIAYTMLREEKIVLYVHAWVAIIQTDGSFEVSRMD